MSKWLRIDEEVPKDKQEVFYYFGYFDEVCTGSYRKGTPTEIDGEEYYFADHLFIGQGFLGDDVTYWMPRDSKDPLPDPPSDEEKKTDRYHPAKTCTVCGDLVISGKLREHAEAHNPNAAGMKFDELPFK